MFLPTRIVHPYERVPYATYSLISVNVLIFVLTWGRLRGVVERFALDTQDFALHQLITGQFLHLGVIHLVGNMLFLAVYGRYVEERLGPLRYLAAYLFFGVVGAATYLAASEGVGAGASGAISGLMGFVMVVAPWAEVSVVFIFYYFVRPFHLAAFWLVGLWILFQVLRALRAGPWDDVAYSAHFGGFLAGCALGALLRNPVCKGTKWYVDPTPLEGGVEAVRRLRRSRGWLSRAEPAPTHEVVLRSIKEAPSQVALIKLLMVRCGMEPDAGRKRLDALLDGEPQSFVFPDAGSASAFAQEARQLGADSALKTP